MGAAVASAVEAEVTVAVADSSCSSANGANLAYPFVLLLLASSSRKFCGLLN